MTLRLTLILIALTLAVFALSLSALPAEAGRCHSREQCQSHGWTWYGSHSKAKRKEVVRSEPSDRSSRVRSESKLHRNGGRVTPPRKEVMPSHQRILIGLIGAAAMVTAPETQPRPAPRLLNTPDGAEAFNAAVRTRFADADDFKAVPIPQAQVRRAPERSHATAATVLVGLLVAALVALWISRRVGRDSGPRVSFPFDAAHLTQKWAKSHRRAAVERREAWEFDGLPWLPWRLTPEWEVMARVAKGKARPLVEFEPA
jgi:hypothetical protein